MCTPLVQNIILTEQLLVQGKQPVNSRAWTIAAKWAGSTRPSGAQRRGMTGLVVQGGRGSSSGTGGRDLLDGKVVPPLLGPPGWPGIRGGVQR